MEESAELRFNYVLTWRAPLVWWLPWVRVTRSYAKYTTDENAREMRDAIRACGYPVSLERVT